LVLRRGVGAIVAGGMRYASSSGCGSSSRGAHRVALGFLLRMAADGLLLSVIVERHPGWKWLALRCASTDLFGLLDGCLLRRGGGIVLGSARHGGLADCVCVFVMERCCLFGRIRAGVSALRLY
jgi:hypothetical protein